MVILLFVYIYTLICQNYSIIIFHIIIMISFLIVLALIITAHSTPINRNIQNLQAGTFIFTNTGTNTASSQSKLYLWNFQKKFDAVPQLSFAINSFQLTNASLVGSFNIQTEIITEFGAIVSWQRQVVRWSSLTLNYLASSRKDLLLGYNQLSFKTNNSQDFDINLKTNISNFSTSVVRVYLTGCDAESVFDCGISGKKMTESVLTVSAYLPAGVKTGNLSFSFIIFSPNSANFSSYGGMLDKTGFKGALALDIRRVLYRTKNILYGFSMLNFSLLASQSVNLDIDSDMVLSLSSMNTIDKIRLIYIGIGMTSKELCNTTSFGFEWNDQCIASCPNTTYIMNYNNGGNSCNSCSKKLNLVLGDKGCICAEGFFMVNQSCISSNDSSLSNGKSSSSSSSSSSQNSSTSSSKNSSGSSSSTSNGKSNTVNVPSSKSSAEGKNTPQTANKNKNSSSISEQTANQSQNSATNSSSTATVISINGSSIPTTAQAKVIEAKITSNVNELQNNSQTTSNATSSVTDTSNALDKTKQTVLNSSNTQNSTKSIQSGANSTQSSNKDMKIPVADQNIDKSSKKMPIVYQTQVRTAQPSQPQVTSAQPSIFQEQPLISTQTTSFSNSSLCTANAYYMDGRCYCLPGFRNSSGKCATIQIQYQTMAIDLTQKNDCPQKIQQSLCSTDEQQFHQYSNSPLCNQIDQKYDGSNKKYCPNGNTQLRCPKGYISYDKKCVKCPSPASFDYINGKCNYFCGKFATYNNNSQRCECQIGYGIGQDGMCGYCSDGTFLLDGYCVRCANDKIYDYASKSCKCGPGAVQTTNGCVSRCGQFQNYDLMTDSCKCEEGLGRIQGKCQLCAANQRVDSDGLCTACPANQQLIEGKCVCASGYVLTDNGCVSCQQIQSFSTDGICSFCALGYNFVNGTCVISPTLNSVAGKKVGIDNAVNLERAAICGNGIIEGLEQCDDRNTKNGDGCDSRCRIETGYTCSRMPSQCIKSSNNAKTTQINSDNKQSSSNPTRSSNSQNTSNPATSNPAKNQGATRGTPSSTAGSLTTSAGSANAPIKSSQPGLNLQGSPSGNSNQLYFTVNTGIAIDFPDQATMREFLKPKFQGYKSPTFYSTQRPKPDKNLFDCLLIFPSGVPTTKFSLTLSYSYKGFSSELLIDIDPLTINSATNSRGSAREASIKG